MTASIPMVERLLVAAMVSAALTLMASPPSVAQTASTTGDHRSVPESAIDGEYYDVLENGTLLYEGDIGVDCRTLLQRFDEELFSTQQMVEACTEAGFPPKGTLSETGGVPLLPVAVGVLLVAGLLVRAMAPRRGP